MLNSVIKSYVYCLRNCLIWCIVTDSKLQKFRADASSFWVIGKPTLLSIYSSHSINVPPKEIGEAQSIYKSVFCLHLCIHPKVLQSIRVHIGLVQNFVIALRAGASSFFE